MKMEIYEVNKNDSPMNWCSTYLLCERRAFSRLHLISANFVERKLINGVHASTRRINGAADDAINYRLL